MNKPTIRIYYRHAYTYKLRKKPFQWPMKIRNVDPKNQHIKILTR
jgi:hypothetical protein